MRFMNGLALRLTRQPWFERTVLALIVGNALLMGLETSPAAANWLGPALPSLHAAVQALFVAEIALRVAAARPGPAAFLRDGWNLFDSAVVAASLLLVAGPFATVARLARVLRVARLVSVAPELRLIVTTMLRSIPSLGHVVALLSVLLYVYGVLGVHLFRDEDPAHWGSLGTALLSLFQILTLEGWVEMQREVVDTLPWAWAYFASYVVLAVCVVINLFIAVVINNLQTVKAEGAADTGSGAPAARARIAALRAELDRLESELAEPRH
jgi:voltage-gated sodium channel